MLSVSWPAFIGTMCLSSISILIFLLEISLVLCKDVNESIFKTVKTESGHVTGKLEATIRHHQKFYAFRGIPYAKPPIGGLRFKVMLITIFT